MNRCILIVNSRQKSVMKSITCSNNKMAGKRPITMINATTAKRLEAYLS